MARPRRAPHATPRNSSFRRASKFQPAPPRARWARPLLRYVLALVSAAIMVNALFGTRGLINSMRARQEYAALEARVQRVRAENARMREEARRLREDPLAIEGLARDRLGLIYPGETVFLLAPVEAQREPRRGGPQEP